MLSLSGLSEKAVAVLESVVFALMDNLQIMQNTNTTLESIHIGGGLSQFDGLCQKLTDLTGLKVMRPHIHEISALGAAMYLLHKPMESVEGVLFVPAQDDLLKNRYGRYRVEILNMVKSDRAL